MMKQGLNSPLTSSCGRLFDAVAALIGIRQTVNYEAQAAIELELAASDSRDAGTYPLTLKKTGNTWIIYTRALFQGITTDLNHDVQPAIISRRFHNSLIHVLHELACLAKDNSGLTRVCLSGGTFNNLSLQDGLTSSLSAAGFEVFTQHEVPAGDGGLCLGQAVIAGHRCQRSKCAVGSAIRNGYPNAESIPVSISKEHS
jgi:hydrogenase maturation protein HypF